MWIKIRLNKVQCNNCDEIFDEEDLEEGEEYRGDYWGEHAYEKCYYCPFCGSDDWSEV